MPHPATQKQITTELSTRQVTLSANQPIEVFEAIVYNDSDRFASFQVKLLAAGAMTEGKPWYRLTPSVSAKIPIGDCTRFQIEIFDLPPISQQFRGAIDLTVEVTSRELVNQYDRPSLRLLADGLQGQPPTISLLLPALEAHPGDRVAIVAQVAAAAAPLDAILRLQGLPEAWFPEGTQQHLSLLPGKPQKVMFDCQVPPPLEAPSQAYSLRLEATGRFPSVTATGQMLILPAGLLAFRCHPGEAAIPERLGTWINPAQGTAKFLLEFDNLSNLEPGVQMAVQEVPPLRWWRKAANSFAAPELVVPNATVLPTGVTITPLPAALPVGITALPLQIQRRLPWLGWTRSCQLRVTAQLLDAAVPLQPETQTLNLYLFPIIPRWLQLLVVLLTLGLGAVWTLLSDPGHRAAVNSVQFSGQGTEVLSGSDDQTIRRWQIQTDSLHTKTRIGNLNKAVRVVRYRPVNNDQIALGFENGEIQLANLLTGKRSQLTPDKDDRVFDLVFSRDARTLFSGHGSGLVMQWDISQFEPEQTQPARAYDAKFTIQSMALVGDDDQLAIGGRYNRLLLLDIEAVKPTAINVAYPSGGASDYISSLSRAEQQSNLLAVGDTKGQLSLWDMQDCQKNRGRCQPSDSWLEQGGSPVRSVALSTDGCFLASAGDDGLVRLWALDGQGRRSGATEGRVLGRSQKPLNAVDIIATRDTVWVTSGGSDAQVRLYPVRLAEQLNDRCPVLGGG